MSRPIFQPASPPSALTVMLALSLLLGLQPVTTDLYLPSLPQMPASLGVSEAHVQWTLSVLVMSFGLGQMLWGPVSDQWGRRPTLLLGLGVFVAASALAVWSPSFAVLLLARAVQGLGLAASVVCGRAMIRDLYAPQEGARVLSRGLSGLGLIALVGPIAGGLVATHLGWRATLGVVGLFGLCAWLYIATRLPETLPPQRRQGALSLVQHARQWQGIAQVPMFRAYTSLTSATYGGLYVFLAASPFVFIDTLGVQRSQYGLLLSSMSLCYVAGTVWCRHSLARRGLPATVKRGAACSVGSGLWCLGLSAWSAVQHQHPPAGALLPGVWLYAVGHGMHQPCSQAGVVASFSRQAGAASALSGFIMSALAVAIGAVLSRLMQAPGWAHTIHPMMVSLGLGACCTAWVGLGLVQRDGHPAPALARATG